MPAASRAPRRSQAPAGGEGLTFPPYGRSKGAPIAGASVQDLEFYINGSRRSLDDPSKARWHEKERVLLAAMEAELERQRGGGGGGRGRGPAAQGSDPFDDTPPYTDDDDIPF
ncbi:MAG: hypothetical protein QM778_03370 [Myxococcales bacterium]